MIISDDRVDECEIKFGILLVIGYALASYLYHPEYLSSLPHRFINDMPMSSGRFVLFVFGSMIANELLHALPVVVSKGSLKSVKFSGGKFRLHTHFRSPLSKSLYAFAIALPVLILGFGLLVYAVVNDDYILQFISLINMMGSSDDLLVLNALRKEEKGVQIRVVQRKVGYSLIQ